MTSFPVVQTTHYLLIWTIKYAVSNFWYLMEKYGWNIAHKLYDQKIFHKWTLIQWPKNSSNEALNSLNEKKVYSSNEQTAIKFII